MKESAQSEASQSHSANSFASRNQLAARKHKHVIQAVKIQWRALLLAIVALVTVLFYWVCTHYIIAIWEREPNHLIMYAW